MNHSREEARNVRRGGSRSAEWNATATHCRAGRHPWKASPNQNGCAACREERQRRKRLVTPYVNTEADKARIRRWTYAKRLSDPAFVARAAAAQRERYRRKRQALMERLGGAFCACCGEAEYSFLSFDHIHGGGRKDVRADGRGNSANYGWMNRKLQQPDVRTHLQVLCHNCNMGRAQNDGHCPHVMEISEGLAV